MHFFVYKAKKKQQFEFEPVPSAGPPAVADITSATFALALTNLLQTGESKWFTPQAAEDAVPPSLPCRHPFLLLQSALTPGLVHQLCSLPLEHQPSTGTPFLTTYRKTLQSTVTPSPQRQRSL